MSSRSRIVALGLAVGWLAFEAVPAHAYDF